MMNHVTKSLWLLGSTVVICCLIYPLAVWAIGQTFFPFTANGSMVNGPDGKPVGSLLIAQPFTKDEYFWPRPSAASYDGSASASSTLAASNYALRDRVRANSARSLNTPAARKKDNWSRPTSRRGFNRINTRATHTSSRNGPITTTSSRRGWVSADPSHAQYINDWAKGHKAEVADWVKQNPGTPEPQASDLAVVFFENFSKQYPGKFPSAVTTQLPGGKSQTVDRARGERFGYPIDLLRYVAPGPSGCRPCRRSWRHGHHFRFRARSAHHAAECRVPTRSRCVEMGGRHEADPAQVHSEIEQMLQSDAFAPLGGLVGEKMINVLQVNLELTKRYGAPQG